MGSSGYPVSKRLEGKVALITGGSSGIGSAIASLFVRHGAKVVVTDIQDELGLAFVRTLGSSQEAIYVHCNVTVESDVQNAVDTAVATYGKLDIMCSNAGIYGKPTTSILETDYEVVKNVFDVNVFGAFLCAKHAARVMIPEKKKGTIIFTASTSSVVFGIVSDAYTASKCAVVGLSKNLCVELGQHGIRVNCISPHFVSTPLTLQVSGIPDKRKGDEVFSAAGNLKGEVLHENDCAEAALYLASEDSSKYVSGLNLVIDGGFSTTNPSHPEIKKNAVQ